MRCLTPVFLGCLGLGLLGCGGPKGSGSDAKLGTGPAGTATAEPSHKERIIGTWVMTKSETLPPGATAVVEFTKDGKMKFSTGKSKEFDQEGTYTVDGDKLDTVFSGKKETAKIKKLTDSQLVIEDDKGKIDEYKRK